MKINNFIKKRRPKEKEIFTLKTKKIGVG